MVNYAVITSFIGSIVLFVIGTTLTWSSPVGYKLTHNSTNEEDLPFGRVISKNEISWISSLLALGAVFGPFIFGFTADKFGRRVTMFALGFPFLASYLMLAFSKEIWLYYVARFLSGLAVGGVFTVIPMYLSEIVDAKIRGALGAATNCFVTGGFLVSYVIGPYVSIMIFNVILAIFPALFLVSFYFLAPESPYFYIKKGDHKSAEESLVKLRGGHKNVLQELEVIKVSIEKSERGTLGDLFKSKALIKAFVTSLALVGFQQFSGINAVLFYSQSIFSLTGSSLDDAVSSIIVGSVQFASSFFTPFIADRFGRRPLLLISSLGMVIAEVALGAYFYVKDDGGDVSGISWLPVVSLVFYIISYNLAFGPLPFVVAGEVFPSKVKGLALSLNSAFCWFLGFLIGNFFESINDSIGIAASFWIFAGFCAAAFVFCYFYLIETKGKTLQEIQDILSS